jgi:hypothetical protein
MLADAARIKDVEKKEEQTVHRELHGKQEIEDYINSLM